MPSYVIVSKVRSRTGRCRSNPSSKRSTSPLKNSVCLSTESTPRCLHAKMTKISHCPIEPTLLLLPGLAACSVVHPPYSLEHPQRQHPIAVVSTVLRPALVVAALPHVGHPKLLAPCGPSYILPLLFQPMDTVVIVAVELASMTAVGCGALAARAVPGHDTLRIGLQQR